MEKKRIPKVYCFLTFLSGKENDTMLFLKQNSSGIKNIINKCEKKPLSDFNLCPCGQFSNQIICYP
jgi:hypothetical protein